MKTIIKDTIQQLEDDLSYWAKYMADSMLKYPSLDIKHSKNRLCINAFLLNLVQAYDINISKYIPEIEEAKDA